MITDLLILVAYASLTIVAPVVAIIVFRWAKLRYRIACEFQKISVGSFNFKT